LLPIGLFEEIWNDLIDCKRPNPEKPFYVNVCLR